MAESAEYLRYFPYDTPYDAQREAMDRIHNALVRGQDVLFEGACGTGKTLSALVPALAVARERDATVVITTNVHQQMRQFVEEASAIAERASIRAVVFKGKRSMCHLDVGYEECQTLRDATRELVETEREYADLERRQRQLLERSREGDAEAAESRAAVMEELDRLNGELGELGDRNVCDHYYRNLTAAGAADAFGEWLFEDVHRPEAIYDYADERGLCGYELLKDGIDGVDLVVCNYHHLLDPGIREAFFRWIGREPAEVIAVFDEAHNLEDAARDHARRTCSERTFQGALDELDDVDDPRADDAGNVIGTFLDSLRTCSVESLTAAERNRVGGSWTDVPIDNDDRRDDLTLAFLRSYTGRGIGADVDAALALGRELDAAYEEAYRRGETQTRTTCQTLAAAAFLEGWMADGPSAGVYPVAAVRRDEGTESLYGRAELYSCLPQQVTGPLFDSLSATVLMSATLQPFDVTSTVLGMDAPVTMAYGLDFPAENRRTYAVETPALFASEREDPDVQDVVATTIANAVRVTPGNTLAFFPNYGEASRYAERVDPLVDSTVYRDEAGVDVEEMRQTFVDDGDGLLCTSLWGTLAEGVSFDGEAARTVLVVGVPYPHLDERSEAVQAAYEAAFEGTATGWRYAVEIPTVRKTRQALGRVLRSPTDVGVRALLDRRYSGRAKAELGTYSVNGTFPMVEREELIDVEPAKLTFAMRNFYADHDAYDGSPPDP